MLTLNTSAEHDLARFALDRIAFREAPDPVAWCEENVMIIDKQSNYQGYFTTSNAAYLRRPLRVMCGVDENGDPYPYSAVTLRWATQVFKTTCLIGFGAYVLCNKPGPLLWIFDSRDNARDFSKERWQEIVNNSPSLASKKPIRADDFTDMAQEFTGGIYHFVGSNSLGRVSSKSKRYIVRDEVDKFRDTLKNEAGAIQQSGERARAWDDSMQIDVSSPSDWYGPINQRYLLGNRERYYMQSPHCGHWFPFTFGGIKWDPANRIRSGIWDLEGVEASAYYECPFTGLPIYEAQKHDLLDTGAWFDEATLLTGEILKPYRNTQQSKSLLKEIEEQNADEVQRDPGMISSTISAIYSEHTSCTFGKIAKNHLLAGKDPVKRKGFVNMTLGEVSKEAVQKVEHAPLLERLEDYQVEPLPPGVLLIVGAADLQEGGQRKPARIEYEIVGMGKGNESWGLEYGIIPLDPNQQAAWKELEAVLQRTFRHPCGITLPIASFGVDTGYATESAYRFISPRENRVLSTGHRQRVVALKGDKGAPGDALYSRPRKTTVNEVRLFMVSRYAGNQAVHKSIGIGKPASWEPGQPCPGYQHFRRGPGRECPGYDAEYFKQLTSEYLLFKYKAGHRVGEYHKRGANESLAVRRYAWAVAALLNADFSAIEHKYSQLELLKNDKPDATSGESPAKTRKPIVHSKKGWMSGY